MTTYSLNLRASDIIAVLFISVLSCVQCYAQSGSTNPRNYSQFNIGPGVDDNDDDTTSIQTNDTGNASIVSYGIYGGLGASMIAGKKGGLSRSGTGVNWALGAQINFAINAGNIHCRQMFSVGLELQNFNATFSQSTSYDYIKYNNHHYYYLGVPIGFHLVGMKPKSNKKLPVSYYAEALVACGIKLHMTDLVSDNGTDTRINITQYYHMLSLYPMISAGISSSVRNRSFLLGPYLGYTVNNLNKVGGGATINVLTGGIRLCALL